VLKHKILAWLWRWAAYLASKYLYGPWSKLYRKIFERKYKKLPEDTPWSALKVRIFFRKCTWVKDKWYMFWDAISKAEKFYETKRGDCDEFACFAGTVMKGPCYIMSVNWYDSRKGEKTFGGHNVLMYFGKGGMYHISNRGIRGPYKKFYNMIYEIPPKDSIPCAYAVREVDNLDWIIGERLERN
jgi:hypothetical protein